MGDSRTGADLGQWIDLAQEPAFELGAARVLPAYREVVVGPLSVGLQPRVMQVLVCLAQASGEPVSRAVLAQRCWGGVAVSEDAVNRCIQRLRRLSEDEAGDCYVIETIPRVGFRLRRRAAAPEGHETRVASAGPAAPEEQVGGEQRTARTHPEPLLAVLAFDNLSGDPEMAFFSDGVSEEILQTVARGAELKVVGRSSSFQFRGADKAAKRVGDALNATHVLDGSVRRSGAKVRIAVNLIECEHETTLWSDVFDRELSDVFAIEDEIAGAVADALKVAFSPKGKADTIDPAAYSLYLKALEIRNLGLEPDSRRTVIDLLEQAVRLAPQFARAWVFLATMLAGRFRFDDPEGDRAGLRAKVVAAAQTALAIDPGLGGVFQVLGMLEPLAHFAKRESFNQRALALAGADPTVLTLASLFYAEVGAIFRAAELAARAYELDPLYPWAANWHAVTLEKGGRFGEARAMYEACRKLWPESELIAYDAIECAANGDEWDWYDELLQDGQARGFSSDTYRSMVSFTQAVRASDGGGWLAAAQRDFVRRGEVAIRTLVELHRLGMVEEAFDLIERAPFDYMRSSEGRPPNGVLSPIIMFSAFDAPRFREDRRFVRLCAKLGLCDYWIETGHWPDCAAEGVLPYDFKAECARALHPRTNSQPVP
jgi:TolB-like protein